MLKEKHPHTYVLNMIRHSARKRDLAFTITLAQFKEFCSRTGYLHRRGTKSDSLTIDRIDHSKGYHVGNVVLTTHLENSTKGHHVPGEFREQNHCRHLESPERAGDSNASEEPF